MSKSLGNVSTVSDLLAAGHKGETLRLALLSAHYRQPLDWNDALLEQSKATLEKFHSSLHFEQLSDHDSVVVDEADEEVLALLSRSEEHTSELQSLMRHSYAVFCLKKKNKQTL